MLLIHAKNKTKALCECGAQSPRFSDDDFVDWKRSEEGREFYSRHTPHGKTRKVEMGGSQETIEEAAKRIDEKRTKASKKEIDDLVEYFNRSDG